MAGSSSPALSPDSRTVTRVPRCMPAVVSASAEDSSGGAFEASTSPGLRSSPWRASHFMTRA